jgi:hypothetical protein
MRWLSNLWDPTNEFLAQSCHIGWGAFLSLILCLIGPWWFAPVALVSGSFLKEFVVDLYWLHETTTWQAETADFGFTCLGVGLGILTWWLTGAK